MNLTNEQIQALKAAAEKATPGEWTSGDYVPGCGCYVHWKGCVVATSSWGPIYPAEPYAEHQSKANANLIAAANPAVILSLLAEREADKALIAAQEKSIDFLKEQLAQLANFNPDWDKLEAATYSLREHMAELTAANKRIAELEKYTKDRDEENQGLMLTVGRLRTEPEEARTLTVKLPGRKSASDYVEDEFDNSDLAAIYNACRLECEVKIKNACAAAGITLVVEE